MTLFLLIDTGDLAEIGHEDGAASGRAVNETLQHLTREVRHMRDEVQRLIDQVTNLKTQKSSSDQAWALMTQQTSDLKQQVATLQSQAAAGGVDADSIDAIVKAANDIHEVATSLQQAVPANTTDAGGQQAGGAGQAG